MAGAGGLGLLEHDAGLLELLERFWSLGAGFGVVWL